MAKFLELFAGVGLVREALEPLGWECVYANDFDPGKRSMYEARFPGHEDFDGRDLWDVSVEELPGSSDMVAASFPCIDLSLAGKRGGLSGTHSSAFWAFVRVLEGLAESGEPPEALMIENVTGFLTSNGGDDIRLAVKSLNELGYRVDIVQVTAEHFTPQSRPRIFVLGLRTVAENMVTPEQLTDGEWRAAVASRPDLRPARIRELMLSGIPPQNSLLSGGDDGLRWGLLDFPALPERRYDFADVVEWDAAEWWDEERTSKALSEMNPLHVARIEAMRSETERTAATAFRRRRNGSSVYEVRSDGVAGCLRTARGGSSTQIVVAAEGGEVRMRWMLPVEYARLQGAVYQPDLENFGAAALRTAFGDAVCVPAVRWVAESAFRSISKGNVTGRVGAAKG